MWECPRDAKQLHETSQELTARLVREPGLISSKLESGKTHASLADELGLLESVLRPRPVCLTPAKKLGQIIGEVLADKPNGITFTSYYKDINMSESTVKRWIEGEGKQLPAPIHLDNLFTLHEKFTGRSFAPERQAEARALRKEACAEPRKALAKYAAVKEELAAKTERDRLAADRVASLRKQVESLELQLASSSSGASTGTSGTQPGSDPTKQQEREELLRRLTRARADLEDALQQKDESNRELRECADRMLKVSAEVERYLKGLPGASMKASEEDEDAEPGDTRHPRSSQDEVRLAVTCQCQRQLQLTPEAYKEAPTIYRHLDQAANATSSAAARTGCSSPAHRPGGS